MTKMCFFKLPIYATGNFTTLPTGNKGVHVSLCVIRPEEQSRNLEPGSPLELCFPTDLSGHGCFSFSFPHPSFLCAWRQVMFPTFSSSLFPDYLPCFSLEAPALNPRSLHHSTRYPTSTFAFIVSSWNTFPPGPLYSCLSASLLSGL